MGNIIFFDDDNSEVNNDVDNIIDDEQNVEINQTLSDDGNSKNMKKKTNKKKNRFKVLALTFVILLAVLGTAYGVVSSVYGKFKIDRATLLGGITTNNKGGKDGGLFDIFKSKEAINVFILGTDKSGYLTDSMMLIHYDIKSRATSLISIPRDYRIELNDEMQKKLKIKKKYIKLTELNSYAKAAKLESTASYTTKAVEEMLDIKIDHMVLFEIEAFRKVVDAVGGVEVYVPQNYEYHDPIQNLSISLKKGTQLLNGKQAEGLVRFRQTNSHTGYGDFGRMEAQQYFLSAFVKKVVSMDTLFNFPAVLDSVSDSIYTDADFNQALSLFNTVKSADMTRIYTHTLPGEGKMIDGLYFFIPPTHEEITKLVTEWFENDKSPVKSSKDYKILVQSASKDKAMSEKVIQDLQKNGFTAEYAGRYAENYTMKSQIIVPENGLGQDIKKFLKMSEIVVDPSKLKEEKTIILIVGNVEM